MGFIIDISTAVPAFTIETEDVVQFFSKAFNASPEAKKIIRFLNNRTKITRRYSCIPDYKGRENELYSDDNFDQPLEKRMDLYQKKLVPLASYAVDLLMKKNNINPSQITHLITVSCTGMMAPGFELQLAEKYNLLHAEKTAINFLGCYAGLKAIKQANQITGSDTNACVLIVCTELCSLHYHPTTKNEDIVANLLFGDGAAAVLFCGENNSLIKNKASLKIDAIGSGFIPCTSGLMSWNLSSTAFKMHLSAKVVNALKSNIASSVERFLNGNKMDYWAIHPGGIKIVEAVKDELKLSEKDIEDSLHILQQYGNMSSGTIFFILQRILDKIRESGNAGQNIFSCAFGPGINIEMIRLRSVIYTNEIPSTKSGDVTPKEIIPERTAG